MKPDLHAICWICEDAEDVTIDEEFHPRCQKCADMPNEVGDIHNVMTNLGVEYRRTPEYKAEQQKRKVERRQEIVVMAICAAFGVWSALAWLVGTVHMAQYLRMGR